MKVFISWSGERSKAVAELLDSWIQCVIQAVDPWMSSKDIDRGALWFSEINDELANTSVGIVCLTKENRNKPWILFETGALAKGLTSARVCTFLIDLESTDLESPLAQFNHTLPNKAGLYQLVRTINFSTGPLVLKDQVLERVFETYWPQFEEAFHKILEDIPVTEIKDKRKQDDILLEVLSSVRTLDKRMRSIEGSEIAQSQIETRTGRLTAETLFNVRKTAELIGNLVSQGFTKDEIRRQLRSDGLSNIQVIRAFSEMQDKQP